MAQHQPKPNLRMIRGTAVARSSFKGNPAALLLDRRYETTEKAWTSPADPAFISRSFKDVGGKFSTGAEGEAPIQSADPNLFGAKGSF